MTDNTPHFDTYSPSGRISWRLPAYTLLGAAPAVAAAAWLYAKALMLGLSVMTAPIATLIFAVICAFAIMLALEGGHSRSVGVNTALAPVLSLFALWVRWAVTFNELGSAEALKFASSGVTGWAAMLWHRAVEAAMRNPATFAPTMQCIIWLLELAMVGLICTFVARSTARDPYSESAGRWATPVKGRELYWNGRHSSELARELATQGPQLLASMEVATNLETMMTASEWWTVSVQGRTVRADPVARWLTVSILTHRRTPKGEIKTTSTDVVTAWHVTAEDYALVMQHVAPGERHGESWTSAGRPTPRELESAVAALNTNAYSEAIALAASHCQHPEPLVKTDALRVCALAYSGLAQWEQAFAHFHALFEYEPSAFNALQVATTSVMIGELVRGQAWFEKADALNQESREMSAARLRTGFISALEKRGEFAAILPHLDWLADAYRSVNLTDSTLLWTWGLPFFPEFLARSLPVLRRCMSESEVRDWYLKMYEALDANGKSALDEHLQEMCGTSA